MVVLPGAAVITQHPDGLCGTLIVGNDQATIAKPTKVFTGEKAEGTEQAMITCFARLISGSEGLGTIFQQDQTVAVTDRLNLADGRRQAKQVNRQHRPGSGSDTTLQFCRVDVESVGINVDQHRYGTDVHNGFNSGEEGKPRR